MQKLDLQNCPANSPCQHFFIHFQHLFFAEIINYVLKSMPKLDLQNCPASPPCQHFLNTSFSQRYAITCLKHAKTRAPATQLHAIFTKILIKFRDILRDVCFWMSMFFRTDSLAVLTHCSFLLYFRNPLLWLISSFLPSSHLDPSHAPPLSTRPRPRAMPCAILTAYI